MLDSDRPLSELLRRVIEQASQLLGSDGCCVYRYEPERHELGVAAATGGAVAVRRHDPAGADRRGPSSGRSGSTRRSR